MKSNRIFNHLIGVITVLISISSFAEDLYEGRLILNSSNKAGVLVTGSKNIEGRIVISRNKKVILHQPVTINEISVGLSAGIKFSGDSFIHYQINGLNKNTRVSDLFETFLGINAGATFAIPGPCCITLNKEFMNIENSKGIQITGQGRSTGWMVEFSKAIVKIMPSNKYSERRTISAESLAELSELEYQFAQGSHLISLECKDSSKSSSYFISMNGFNEINFKSYDLNPFKSLFSRSSNPLKPTITNHILNLYPEKINDQVIGNRFDIDLTSEETTQEKDFFGRNLRYSAKLINATSVIQLSCLSKLSLKNSVTDLEKYSSSIWK